MENTIEKRINYLFLALAEEYNEPVHIIQANATLVYFSVKKNLFVDFERQLIGYNKRYLYL